MKQVRQWVYAVCTVLVLMLASCQMGNTELATVAVEKLDEYGEMSVILPSSRGWTAAKYTVTAKRSGEADVIGETTGTSLKMRLKVGRWTFTAVGYDNNNAAIFCSDPVESDIKADGSTVVSIMLTQKSASVDLTANVPTGLQDKLTKIVITAAAKAGEDFTVSKETASIGGKIRLYDLLADCEYTITADGYIGEVKYASGSLSAKKFDNDGQITAETITLKQTRVTPVAASPASGHGFSNADGTITLTCGTAGASIYYTTDGTEPTASSNKYSDPIALFSGTAKSEKTLKAVAFADGMDASDIMTATYSFDPTKYASPTFDPQGGRYNEDKSVTLTSSDSGTIKYSFDNSTWTDYSAAIAINGSQTSDVTKTIYAKVAGDGTKTESAVVSQEYVVSYPTASEVLFSASGSTPYNTETTFTLSCSTESAKIYYTTDGTAPTASATQYSAPFTLTAGTHTIKAIAIADGYKYSDVLVQSLSVVKNITSISISPASADLIVGGSSATFTVIFEPADTNADTTIQWSVNDDAVVRLMPNGTSASVSGLKAGSATLTATLKNASTITATATLNVTTTTIAPVQSTELGKRYPATGVYSPVDSANWGSQTYTLGANIADGNTTFSLYSKNATKVLLEIYDAAYGEDAKYDYWMTKNESTDCWQAKLSGDLSNKLYAFRCWGPNWTYSAEWKRGGSAAGFVSDCDAAGNRFNPNKVVYDPYAREMSHDPSNMAAIAAYTNANTGFAMATPVYQILSTGDTYRNYDSGTIAPKGYIITDSTSFGTKPAIEQKDAIIYEAHVRGLTKHSSTANLKNLLKDYATVSDIPEEYRGTYKGATYMIPYLKAIGINTIELLPVHETDNDANPDNGPGGNFWGYMTFDYFAPDRRYSSDKTAGGPTREFKEMVKAFHDNGMEVYLDVVYNHSGEGGPWNGADDTYQQCTVVSMRGIDNATYYSLVQTNKAAYWESTGCGNNLQCDNTYVRQFILDSLTYWIDKMGVDGFRFDLATTLGRELSGSSWNYNANATTLTQIASLGRTKNVEMIAESWDCGGDSYQVGNFPDGWAGWNGYYRDTIRGFVGNATGSASISYTDALYGDMAHFGLNEPSINFIVAHDGFTLADLASYSGTGNYHNSILTWPFGPSDGGSSDNNPIGTGSDPADRRQRIRNYFTLQMFGAGIPMIVYGDELGRTQNGNNNPYNIDSVATWNNYDMANSASPQAVSCGDSGIPQENGSYENMLGTFTNAYNKNGNLAFAKYVMNERANNESLRQISGGAFEWYSTAGVKGWADEGNKKGILINGSGSIDGATYYMMINMHSENTDFTFPAPSTGNSWMRIIDTQSYFETNLNYWDDSLTAQLYDKSATYGVSKYSIVVFKEVTSPTKCETPVISSSGGSSFAGNTTVTITCATPNATIYYTTDGSEPSSNNGTLYSAAFTLNKTTTVKAIAVKAGCISSAVVTLTLTNTAVCADPVLSVPEGDFWDTITVFSLPDQENVTFYYTTDGTTPTTSSATFPDAGVDISATTTLKVLAHDSTSSKGDAIVSATYTKQTNPSLTENASGVILQGFNWDSTSTSTPYWYTNAIKAQAASIKDTFEYVWLPPPSKTPSFAPQGYIPTELNDLNNYYGTKEELAAAISAISPAKAIADIVINHRGGTSGWGDFSNPKWTSNYYSICSGDEGFTTSGSDMLGLTNYGAADTGDNYDAARDLDHTNVKVQKGIYSWMNSVLKRAGFVGWRYDYVKGYKGDYVGYYNAKSNAAFSVGEYWPTAGFDSSSPSGWSTPISSWVTATSNKVNGTTGKSSRAFDFVLKGLMNTVFGYGDTKNDCNGEGNKNFSLLASTSSLMRSNPSAAVTFIDNHDTGSTQKHWYLDPMDIAPAYAFILTHPGMPCVAWQHYFTYNQSGASGTDSGAQYIGGNKVPGTDMTYRQLIDRLIAVRKSAGITTTSKITDLNVTAEHYIVKVTGTEGELIVKIGGGNYAPNETGYTGKLPVAVGTNFAVWEKDKTVTDYSNASTVDIYLYKPDGWTNPTAHCWTDGGADYDSWPGVYMTADSGSWYKVTVPSACDKVIFSNAGATETGTLSFSSDAPYYKDGAWYASKDKAESGGDTVVFYFKIPTWINKGVVLALNGNGHSWSEITMTACDTTQWYKCSVNVASLSTEITCQPRMTQDSTTKYMKAVNDTSSNQSVSVSTGFVVIDASGNDYLWNGDEFSLKSADLITTPVTDPGY